MTRLHTHKGSTEPDSSTAADSSVEDEELEALAELAEAEAAQAAARAKVARARARAAKLRLPASQTDGEEATSESEVDEPEPGGDDNPGAVEHPEVSRKAPRRWRRPSWTRLTLAAGILGVCAFVAVTAVMVWQHRKVEAQHRRDAEYVQTARHDVEALLSIDYAKAPEDVQRIIDSSTGKFRDDFAKNAKSFVEEAQRAKAVSQVTVSAAALQSISGNSATVLVSVASRVTNANGANQDARGWRMRVTVGRDDGKLKMSNVEFIP